MKKPAAVKSVEESWPASKIEMWPIERIVAYEKNPRTHSQEQIDFIAASMRDDGVTAPILIDEQGVIIAGHGRHLAGLKNGFKKYPVVIARGWSEDRKRAVRIKDNSFALLSGWDADLLQLEVGELKLLGYDLQLLGFDAPTLSGILDPPNAGQADPDDAPEPPVNPVTRKGDVWLLGKHRIMCGDSTNADDVEKLFAGAKPNLLVSDPPYGVEYDANWRNEADRANGKSYGASAIGKVTNDERMDWRESWALFSGNVAYIWHAGRHASIVQSSIESAGFEVVAQIIWAKDRLIISRGDYHWRHEPCWYAVRKGKKHSWSGDRSQTTLWEIPHHKSETGHSTQKPVECMKRPIENNSRKGEWVYDPFIGSGTTAIAAEMTGRKCLGMEISEQYCDVVVERFQTFSGKTAVLAETGATFAATKVARAKTARPAKRPTRAPAARQSPIQETA